MAVGGELFQGNSKLLQGSIGVSQLFFKGYNCGKTTEETMLKGDQDIKDIHFQQDGTKPADHIRTGQEFLVPAVFGKIKTSLLVLMQAGLLSTNTNPNSDNLDFNRSLYVSMRDFEAGVLKIAAIDADGIASELDEDTMVFYEAIAIIDDHMVNWGADTQRNLPVTFKIKYHPFAEGESVAKNGSYGYFGDPTEMDLPAAVWPDVVAPLITAAEATTATNVDVTFDKNIAFQGGAYTEGLIVDVNGEFIVPSGAAIALNVLSITLPAASVANGDIVKTSISSIVIEDTETTPNLFGGASNVATFNSVV